MNTSANVCLIGLANDIGTNIDVIVKTSVGNNTFINETINLPSDWRQYKYITLLQGTGYKPTISLIDS